ncbi:MAG: phosphatase PAP2 family protein [Dysgonamonadaceae bacterium]|jgi:hypothetical protein|nr:phosphatase PAP2 family protein [Dysgonamonadaceae bacterium]
MYRLFLFCISLSFIHPSFPQTNDSIRIDGECYRMGEKELFISAGLITTGLVANITGQKDLFSSSRPNAEKRATPFDDAFQYAPIPMLIAFDAVGNAKHEPLDQFFLLSLSYSITALHVRILKNQFHSTRPYGGPRSFPSGHTAFAVAGAHVIYREFKDSNVWLAYSGYAVGATTAVLRVAHDRHWVCDVLAGAGIAIISTETAYLIYQPVRNFLVERFGRGLASQAAVAPAVYPDGLGISLACRF